MQQVLPLTANRAHGPGRDLLLMEGMLAHLPLFVGVAPREVRQVASRSRVVRARRSEFVCARGDLLPGVFVVAYGMLKLALRRPDGEEKVVRFLRAGESFGEAAVLLERPSPVHAVALEDTRLAVVPSAALRRLLEFDRAFARNLVNTLADRSLGLLAELEASVQQCGMQRLARYLDSLAGPADGAAPCVVRLPARKTEIAARLGMTKESLSRLLRELAQRGAIEVMRSEITIVQRSALLRLA